MPSSVGRPRICLIAKLGAFPPPKLRVLCSSQRRENKQLNQTLGRLHWRKVAKNCQPSGEHSDLQCPFKVRQVLQQQHQHAAGGLSCMHSQHHLATDTVLSITPLMPKRYFCISIEFLALGNKRYKELTLTS